MTDRASSGARRVAGPVRAFYDDLAADYRLLFPDWRASSARQAAALDALIEAELGPAAPSAPARRLLDAAATFRLWTWHDDGQRYDLEHVMLHGHPPTWHVGYRTTTYWAITREELAALAVEAGLDAVRWLLPAESGYVQPLLVARA